MRRIGMSLTVTMLFGLGVFARPIWSQSKGGGCDGNTAEVTPCLFAEFKKAEADLDRLYGQSLAVAARYGVKDVVRLKDAQRKWIAYRLAACDAEFALYQGGTAGGPAEFLCKLRITDERIQGLKITYVDR